MTDPIRTPAEALEAAARACDAIDDPDVRLALGQTAASVARRLAVKIRALSIRIPPAPDDEALVKISLNVLKRDCPACAFGLAECTEEHCPCVNDVRAVLLALREAGALRHE